MNKFVAKYGRILVPLITPYGENEEVDYVQYEKLIDYIITNKLGDSLIVTGTTGEASLLTFDERVKLMETAINAAAGRMPVIAGTGCASTKETIALTQKAEELGIETCLDLYFGKRPGKHQCSIVQNTSALPASNKLLI